MQSEFLVERSELSRCKQTGEEKLGGIERKPKKGVASWPFAARQLLLRKVHRSLFCKTWRALLLLKLPDATFRKVLQQLPSAVLPHVPRPLRYCDLLSDGYDRGGVDAVLALKVSRSTRLMPPITRLPSLFSCPIPIPPS